MNLPLIGRSLSLHCQLLPKVIPSVCSVLLLLLLLFLPLQAVMAARATIEYYHYNHQGSLLEVYDGATNKRLLSQAWSPWGERQVLHASVPGNRHNVAALLASGLPAHLGYTGHKELLATGLVFAGDTRLYDPRLKRFLNPDDRTTGDVRGQNRYSYAYNNPMIFIDPNGHAPDHTPISYGAYSVLRMAATKIQDYGRRYLMRRHTAAAAIQAIWQKNTLNRSEKTTKYVQALEKAYADAFGAMVHKLNLPPAERNDVYHLMYSTESLLDFASNFYPVNSKRKLLALMRRHHETILTIKEGFNTYNQSVWLFGDCRDNASIMAPHLDEYRYHIASDAARRIRQEAGALQTKLLIPQSQLSAMIAVSQAMFPELWQYISNANPQYSQEVRSLDEVLSQRFVTTCDAL